MTRRLVGGEDRMSPKPKHRSSVCVLFAVQAPRRSLAQSRNVGSNDPMASSGQAGVTGWEIQIWVLMLPQSSHPGTARFDQRGRPHCF
ncbi:hypothetical protein N658DRAFT_219806 [Parathielavia hyrcaniae]|uniref:Uncharacterized protein n=1 Tax=Parathielavia hyrcaniae TaxID=113614 RepID=A0AAN6PV16_9PEZI|nr:hypothetical protein N658DRAFT_219806 [Parathielavia hyrcaniae]